MKLQNPKTSFTMSLLTGTSAALLFAVRATGAFAQTIDPGKPLPQSIKPDILYFNFDDVKGTKVPSGVLGGEAAEIKEGRRPPSMGEGQDSPALNWPDGPRAAFKKAIELNRGEAAESGETFAPGKFLVVPAKVAPNLAGKSFTMGAWVKAPGEIDELPGNQTRELLIWGCDYQGSPGFSWALQKIGDLFYVSFASQPGGEPADKIYQRAILKGFKANQWNHIALSLDVERKELTFYLNGKPIGEPRLDPSPVGESPDSLLIGDRGVGISQRLVVEMDDLFIVSGVHDFKPVGL